MKKLIFLLLLIISIASFKCYAEQIVTSDPVWAGTIWYNQIDGQLNHDYFIRFDKEAAICTVGFMGEGKPSEIFDFVYNINDKNEIFLCGLEKPMQPVVILTIHDDHTFEFNLVDKPVGNIYKKIQYSTF